ncbi:MAG: hypothetical protein V1922_00195 [bacterium]
MDILNYSDPESWDRKNAARIAADYGYCLNNNFLAALDQAIQLVHEATYVAMIGSVVQGLFVKWKPPLERIPCEPFLVPTSKKIVTPQGKGCNIFRWMQRAK